METLADGRLTAVSGNKTRFGRLGLGKLTFQEHAVKRP